MSDINDYIYNIKAATKYWIHYNSNAADPIWQSALKSLTQMLVLNNIYNEIKNIDEDKLKENLESSNCHQIINHKSILDWLNETNNPTVNQVIKTIKLIDDLGEEIIDNLDKETNNFRRTDTIKYQLRKELVQQCYSLQAMAASEKTLGTLVQQLLDFSNAAHHHPTM